MAECHCRPGEDASQGYAVSLPVIASSIGALLLLQRGARLNILDTFCSTGGILGATNTVACMWVVLALIEHDKSIINRLAGKQGLSSQEVDHWAVHPGGPKILDAVQKAMTLPHDALVTSREILANYDNMSSPIRLSE
jgi:hypothetical protein